MKMILVALGLSLAISPALAQYGGQRVQGYTNSNGTYVAPYYRSSPNSTRMDNYGTSGNTNPYTGARGTRSPY